MNPGNEMSLVSVIIPTYNRAKLLAEAMDSVRAQTYRPMELIVVDDGSTDDTGEVVQQWSEKVRGDQGLQVRYCYQENQGASAARNRGFLECRGEYVQFLDSDDSLCPGKISTQVAALGDGCPASVTGTRHVRPSSTFVHASDDLPPNPPSADPLDDFVQGKIRPWPTLWLFRRSLLAMCPPWDTSMIVWEDVRFVFGALLKASRVAYVSKPLCTMRHHEGVRASGREVSLEGLRSVGGYFKDLASLLERTHRGNEESRRVVGSLMLRYATQLWGLDRSMSLELRDCAYRLCPKAPPSFGILGRLLWRLGGLRLTGAVWHLRRCAGRGA
jgi:glycosyltransferase involved in cell wall biosynthesis